ncbi:MAG: succinyl-diaminopimelate desuccinylase [Pseudomonadota bacterium]
MSLIENPTIALAAKLISLPSITPNDAGCQKLIADRLIAIGFNAEWFEINDVTNIWLTRGNGSPTLVLAGHTDVVPPGPLEQWKTNPFEAVIEDGIMFGRGSADMKGSLAAMVIAVEEFVKAFSNFSGRIAFLITSDEEGPGIYGTKAVIEKLQNRNEVFEYCIVGEPSCSNHLGDTLRVGRRGSVNGQLRVFGKQGHVAYPQEANNAIHLLAPVLEKLIHIDWKACGKQDSEAASAFPPTAFQWTQILSGDGTTNVISGMASAQFNIRFSTEHSPQSLQEKIEAELNQFSHLRYELDWTVSGLPFLTRPGKLRSSLTEIIHKHTALVPEASAGGGTSDARFIAPTGAEVVEFGVINRSIHQVNESVSCNDLIKLTSIYFDVLKNILINN